MAMPDFTVQALALLIRHLKQFGFERILSLGASFRPFSGTMEMTLSANSIQQLEVIDPFDEVIELLYAWKTLPSAIFNLYS